MLIKGALEYSSPSTRRGRALRLFSTLSTYILVCFSEHWYTCSYAAGCSAFYTTVDASGSYCDSFSVMDGLERFCWWQRRHCDDWVSFSTETDMLFFLFMAANDKRYLTLYKLVISITIIIIIINKWYATISGVADENIDDVGNLHK